MIEFDCLREALTCAIDLYASSGRNYIVNVLLPADAEINRGSTLQIVAEDMVFENGVLGLTVYLPFDPADEPPGMLRQFQMMPGFESFERVRWQGIRTYIRRFGDDVERAAATIEHVLFCLHGAYPGSEVRCSVYDECAPGRDPVYRMLPSHVRRANRRRPGGAI